MSIFFDMLFQSNFEKSLLIKNVQIIFIAWEKGAK